MENIQNKKVRQLKLEYWFYGAVSGVAVAFLVSLVAQLTRA